MTTTLSVWAVMVESEFSTLEDGLLRKCRLPGPKLRSGLAICLAGRMDVKLDAWECQPCPCSRKVRNPQKHLVTKAQ